MLRDIIVAIMFIALLVYSYMTDHKRDNKMWEQIRSQQIQIQMILDKVYKLEIPKTSINKEIFEATAYCDRGLTATGTQARAGVIAVDPNVIPLGSKVLVNGVEYTAEDTGGAVKGNIIDIWLDSERACFEWGRRNVEVVKL